MFKVGTRISPGYGWSYGSTANYTIGTVTRELTTVGTIQVRWDSGVLRTYIMGRSGKYDLCLAYGGEKD